MKIINRRSLFLFFAIFGLVGSSNAGLFSFWNIKTTPGVVEEPTREEIKALLLEATQPISPHSTLTTVANAAKAYTEHPKTQLSTKRETLIAFFNQNIEKSTVKLTLMPPERLPQCSDQELIVLAQLSELLAQSKTKIDFHEKSYCFLDKTAQAKQELLKKLTENHKSSSSLVQWWYPLDTKTEEKEINNLLFNAHRIWEQLTWFYRTRAAELFGASLFGEWLFA